MFGELPKIFERNFVVGYVLPSALFLLVSLGLTHHADLGKLLTIADGASFAVVAFAVGVVLLAANRSITRLLEGYGALDRVRLMTRFRRWRFNRLREQLDATRNEFRSYGDKSKVPAEVKRRGLELETRLIERYPDKEGLVLPTAFGNCVRAFECYPVVMYKLKIVEGWTRLISVVPKEYLDLIDTAKAETDLWLNLWFLSLVTIGDAIFTSRHLLLPLNTEYLTPYIQPLLTIVGACGFAFFASWMAARAAIEWGSTFKAAVDVYLPELYDRLGFPVPASNADAKNYWDQFSDAISYRNPLAMPPRRWVASIPQPSENPPKAAAITQTARPPKPELASGSSAAKVTTPMARPVKIGSFPARAANGPDGSIKDESLPASPKLAVPEPRKNSGVTTEGRAQVPTDRGSAGSSSDEPPAKKS